MKTIFITGAAGFIGSSLVRIALAQKYKVVAIDKLTYAGNTASLSEVTDLEGFHFEQADICDRQQIDELFRDYKPDGIIHLAAESHVDRSIDGPGEFIKTNIDGTFSLLEATRSYLSEAGERLTGSFRFLHVSTDEVYGDLKGSESLFTEKTPYDPSSPYAASKAASDHLVRAWFRTFNLPAMITNCSNNFGPRQFPEKLIPHVILNAIQGKDLPVYGDGKQIRDWLYVDDHSRALITAFEKGSPGETYNIGSNNEKENIEVVRTICDLLEQYVPELKPDSKHSYADQITFVADRPGHDLRYAIDASKIREQLDWTPRETFESGMAKTVKWYLENTTWWKDVLSGDYQLNRIGKLKSDS